MNGTVIEITPASHQPYDDTVKSDHVLALKGTYHRFGLAAIPRGKSGRKVFQGPLVPGPWAFAFGLSSVIAANPEHGTYGDIRRNKAAGLEHEVEAADLIRFDGVTYRIEVERRQYINLVAVEGSK